MKSIYGIIDLKMKILHGNVPYLRNCIDFKEVHLPQELSTVLNHLICAKDWRDIALQSSEKRSHFSHKDLITELH